MSDESFLLLIACIQVAQYDLLQSNETTTMAIVLMTVANVVGNTVPLLFCK